MRADQKVDKKDILGIAEILWSKLFPRGLEPLLHSRIGETMTRYVDSESVPSNE